MSKKTQSSTPIKLTIDCSAVASFAVDLAPGERQGMKATQPGYDAVVAELFNNQALYGEQVGITGMDIDRVTLAGNQIAMIDKLLPDVLKLAEVLEETRAKIDDERHRHISEIAKVVDARSHGSRSTTLLAAYEKTRAYRSAAAQKAVKTRRKNEASAVEDVPASPEA